MTQTFKTLFKTINDALKINLTKEVAHFSIKGYRVDQLALPEVNIETIEELVKTRNCIATETYHIAYILNDILKKDTSDTNMYTVRANSFQKNQIYISIEKVNFNAERNIEVSLTFNIANVKIEFGDTHFGDYRLKKQTIAVTKSIKIGSFTDIPLSLSKKEFENMTPIEFIEYKIKEKEEYNKKIEDIQKKRENAFINELEKHNLSLEDFNKLKRMQPNS